MKALITGVAGFIGSNLADRLLTEGYDVIGVDNLSTGNPKFLESAKTSPKFQFVERDLLTGAPLNDVMRGVDIVFHFAANADVRFGLEAPTRDLEQNILVTSRVLESMRALGVKRIGFSSSGSVYGEASQIPTPETCAFPIQTSLYGASKTAAEGYISSYAEGFGMKGYIFRFVSILGERYTHGHVYDFIKSLKQDPTRLKVLGNGKQRKSYLYVQDCMSAILAAVNHPSDNPVEVYNLGTDEYCDVNGSIAAICEVMGVKPELSYSGGDKGWIGDNPFIFLDCTKIKSTGWRATKTIKESVQLTAKYLLENPWVYNRG
jgi:UDP-glucose 4-epimerase